MRSLACIAAVVCVILLGGCRQPTAGPLVEQRDARTGFVVRVPSDWTRSTTDDGLHTRYVPPGVTAPETSSEFIAVYVADTPGPLDEAGARRLVFSSLPIHGVSGFVQDPRTTATVRWDKFEVTGSSGEVEWASVGVVVSGSARAYLLICAKPFQLWREGQKQCDETVKTFQPGRLN
ncbi:MAG TPA: hypothetical protein VGK88_08080 [bacterium]|jgi:hypothetical protein